MMLREGKIQFKDYVIYHQITTTYIIWRKYFSVSSISVCFCILKNSTLHVLTPNLGILKEAKNENMISYSVIHLTSPFPDFQRCVNLSAALEVSIINNFRILPCWLKHWELLGLNLEKWLQL